LGVVPELAMELFGPVAGVALFALTGRDDFAVLCRRVGESLRRFHALEVAIDETFDTREQAARLAENAVEFTWMLPAAATRIVALAREIDARLHATPSRLGVIHRDFHGDNVLVAGDTLALVDFEDCAMGEAADDVASNWAQLRWHEHRAPDRSARLAAARRAFLGGYLDAGDTRSAVGLPAYAAMHAFLYAHQCLRHPQDRTRRDDALVMLAACEQALDGDLT
jgi:Ser/Thr protein kinase RdoA (MazF antagonist)